MTFTEWLLREKQQNRRGPIGAIAREVSTDSTWPSGATALSEYRRYLQSLGANIYATEALRRAWLAYKCQEHLLLVKEASQWTHTL